MPWFGPAPSTSWTLGRSFQCTRHWDFVTILICTAVQISIINMRQSMIGRQIITRLPIKLQSWTQWHCTDLELTLWKVIRARNYGQDFCFVFWWQAWAHTESGVIRSCAAYCIDRFQRYSASRLYMDDATHARHISKFDIHLISKKKRASYNILYLIYIIYMYIYVINNIACMHILRSAQ